jgi:hypothetical protein
MAGGMGGSPGFGGGGAGLLGKGTAPVFSAGALLLVATLMSSRHGCSAVCHHCGRVTLGLQHPLPRRSILCIALIASATF